MKAEAVTCSGLLSGRQSRSPAPVQSASPSESWTSGRQSTRYGRLPSENQYIDVSGARPRRRSEEHTSELQSLMRISYAVFCLKQKKIYTQPHTCLLLLNCQY